MKWRIAKHDKSGCVCRKLDSQHISSFQFHHFSNSGSCLVFEAFPAFARHLFPEGPKSGNPRSLKISRLSQQRAENLKKNVAIGRKTEYIAFFCWFRRQDLVGFCRPYGNE
jgi:hypothetical protein